jgi:hypothetical protein
VPLALRLLSISVKVMDHPLVVVQCDVEVVAEAVAAVHLMDVAVAAEVVVVAVIVVAIKTIQRTRNICYFCPHLFLFVFYVCVYISVAKNNNNNK